MERDDLVQDHSYSVSANHDEAHGVEIRKKIWKVTGILAIVTIIEVALGLYGTGAGMPKGLVNVFFLLLTIYKKLKKLIYKILYWIKRIKLY